MKLIVGLGNIGKKYEGTRHNVGFEVVDLIADTHNSGLWLSKDKLEAQLSEISLFNEKCLLVKPSTMMNLSGRSVRKIADFYKIDIESIWIIHDDLDLPLGEIRIKKGGGSGGHHGLDSIISCVGSNDFLRFRCGIGKKVDKKVMTENEGSNYVVGKFASAEKKDCELMIKKCVEEVEFCLQFDYERGMNKYN